MKLYFRTAILTFLWSAGTFCEPVFAQGTQDAEAQARDLFLSSVILQAQIEVCGKRLPKLSEKLLQALDNWKKQNSAALKYGEAMARKEWGDQSPPFEDHLQHFKIKAAGLFELASDADIDGQCESLLEK